MFFERLIDIIIFLILIRVAVIDYKSYYITQNSIIKLSLISILYNIFLIKERKFEIILSNLITCLCIYILYIITLKLFNIILKKKSDNSYAQIEEVYSNNTYNKMVVYLIYILGYGLLIFYVFHNKISIIILMITVVIEFVLNKLFKKYEEKEEDINNELKDEIETNNNDKDFIGFGDILIIMLLTSIYSLKGFIIIVVYSCYCQIIIVILYYIFSKNKYQYKCTPFILGLSCGFFMFLMKFNILHLYEIVNLFLN